MSEIYSLVSDSVFTDEFINCLRNRELDQKFLYQWGVASLYYKNSLNSKVYEKSGTETIQDFILDFGVNNIFNIDKRLSLISLGCGNSAIEKEILEIASEEGCSIEYMGVDSSEDMLELSVKNLEKVNCEKKYIQADFATRSFQSEIRHIGDESAVKMFCLFGNTFGNIKETNIIDILGDILEKGDRIWITVALRNGVTETDNLALLDAYQQVLGNDTIMQIYFSALGKFGVPFHNGKVGLMSSIEPSIGAQKFRFYFEFIKKTEINIRGDNIIFLPGEKVFLQKIYEYNDEKFIHFFAEHHLKCISSNKMEGVFSQWGQFLFEKE